MQQESDRLRVSIESFMNLRDLKVHPWSVQAGVSPGALRNFLKGRSDTLRHETLKQLAEAAGARVGVLVGNELDPLSLEISEGEKQVEIPQESQDKILIKILERLESIEARLIVQEKVLRALAEKAG